MIYTFFVLLIFVNWFSVGALLVYSWRHRSTPATHAFFWLTVTMFIWITASSVASFAGSVRQATFWYIQARFVGIVLLPVALFVFSLVYIGRQAWVTRFRVLILCIIPAITIANVWLRPDTFVAEIQFYPHSGFLLNAGVRYVGLFWVHVAYGYTLITASLVLVLWYARRAQQPYRGQATMFVVGLSIAFAVNIVANLLFNPPRPAFHDLNALSIGFTFVLWAVALFRYQLLDIMPVARDAVLESMNDAVLVLDTQNRVVDCNPAAESMIPVGRAVVGQSVPHAFPNHQSLVEQYLNTADAQVELEIMVDNAPRFYDLCISTLKMRGYEIGRLVVLRDNTRRRQAEQRAHQLELEEERRRILTGFVQDISHEFRTPLTAIKTAAYLMAHQEESGQRHARKELIDHEVDRVTTLVDNLLLMVKLDSENALSTTTIDLHDALQQAVETVRKGYANHRGAFTYGLMSDSVQIKGDYDLIVRAFHAVVDNSFHHTPPDSAIGISTMLENEKVQVTVVDTGPGIPPDDLPSVFDRFFRGDIAHTTAGFGLGLPTARRILELHGGSISVESTLGEGTQVRIMLPVMREDLYEGHR